MLLLARNIKEGHTLLVPAGGSIYSKRVKEVLVNEDFTYLMFKFDDFPSHFVEYGALVEVAH